MITKRVLTLKSKVGFGKYGNETIGRLIECDCAGWVRYIYYTCGAIDYADEVKQAAQIFISIEKPGINPEARVENERKVWALLKGAMTERQYMGKVARAKHTARINAATKRHLSRLDGFSKGRMQAVNHGHGFIKRK